MALRPLTNRATAGHLGAAPLTPQRASSAVGALPIARAGARSVRWRLLLVVGTMAVAAAAALATDTAPGEADDAAFVRLMHGMAMIKGAIVLVAAAVLWWRFARPVTTGFAAGYLFGAWLMVAATVLIWQLSTIGAAAVMFHTGELSLLLLAWRDTRSA